MPWLPYNEADLRRCFNKNAFERGRAYASSGRVEDISYAGAEDALRLTADVYGTAALPYEIAAYVELSSGVPNLSGECTCPVELDCKHVVAVLFAALAESAQSHDRQVSHFEREIAAWLQRLDEARSPKEDVNPQGLLYFLDAPASYSELLPLRLGVSRRTKTGAWGAVRSYSVETFASSVASFLSAQDRVIAARLSVLRRLSYQRDEAAADLCAQTLRGIIETGRAYYHSQNEAPLVLGEPRRAHVHWRLLNDGTQRAALAADTDGTAVLPTFAPWYADPERALSGPLAPGLPIVLLNEFLHAPPIEPLQAAAVVAALDQRFGSEEGVRTPLPRVEREVRTVAPVPRLRLSNRKTTEYRYYTARYQRLEDDTFRLKADLSFDYAGERITLQDRRPEFSRVEGERIVVVPRNTRAEHAAATRLAREVPDGEIGPVQLTRVLREVLPALEDEGWQIEVEASLRRRVLDLASPDARWETSLAHRNGWFDLDVGVDVQGSHISLIPLLAQILRSGVPIDAQAEYVYAHDGDRTIVLPGERVRFILDTLAELHEEPEIGSDGKLAVNRVAALAAVRAIPEIAAQDAETKALAALAQRLASFDGVMQARVPRTLRAELRPYQHEGYRWFQSLREYGCGGILADDMGLGKSIQSIVHILREKQARRLDKPALVVVPTSMVPNWRSEFERFAPSLNVVIWHGSKRKERIAEISQTDVVITTYALLARDSAICKQHWHIAILDEAQAIKNPQSKVAQTAGSLRAEQRICLTGTPMENHLGELWSLVNFVMPHALYDQRRFTRLFRTPIEKRSDAARREALAKRIRPFLLRRTKQDVEIQLPPKTEIVERVQLEGSQRDLYESVRVAMQRRVQQEIERVGIARSRITVLDALLKLRQVCCDPRLLKIETARHAHESAKLDWMIETVKQLVQEQRRTLIFSQFTSMIDLIKPRLRSEDIDYVELVGSTVDRAAPVARFQQGEVPVFLISLKAGGTGLNLTAADTVIHYDPWWNPAVERQATDRAHRIGQDKSVFVYKLIAADTVEDKILELQARKASLAGALFDAAKADSIDLTRSDIEELFKPVD